MALHCGRISRDQAHVYVEVVMVMVARVSFTVKGMCYGGSLRGATYGNVSYDGRFLHGVASSE